ncbi:hypothetical protein SDRG_13416 [Saprolegnia diclina VS20]|uniref:DUF6604 domain-containing protein n=1 Tax=Saprolegnia diclina (strain VS20) TaxID=1156394 RepID=T0Q2Y6_SAPDV|nr:hypothetical protein SDRG_13416 [Saprolegnia diclina VS20]EQC28906.1 hypothetical protein SDRG_13416 [Saprolegnia diclina VS20]|eukprot:XP_008617723.1 hypothetical protein SDRG_13416 [Saprolegnia diclina VS20]
MSSRWHQYKAATDAVVSWLQRATATKATKATATATSGATTTKSIWAAAVAVAEMGLPVPAHIWTELATCIRLRWMATRSLPPDAGHMYFLFLLRAVRSKLAPLRPTATRRKPATSSGLSNAFAALAVDDDNDDDGDMPPFDASAYTPPPHEDPRMAQLQADQFRTMCFVLDMDELMGEVRAVWAAFKQGETTLVAAAAVTNHSVRVVESLASELSLELPYLQTLGEIDILLGQSMLFHRLVRCTDLSLGDAVERCFKMRWAPADDTLDALVVDTIRLFKLSPKVGTIPALRRLATPRFDWTSTTKHLGGGSNLDQLYILMATVATMLRNRQQMEADVVFQWDEATAPAPCISALHGTLINDILVPLLSVLTQRPSKNDDSFRTSDDFRFTKGITATLQPYMTLVNGLAKNTVATTELVFATQCLLVSILAVQGPSSNAITCASVAASTIRALKAAYRHVLAAMQRPDIAPNNVDWLQTQAGALRFSLWAATSNADATPEVRLRTWLNPWMAGQRLLESALSVHFVLGIQIMDDMKPSVILLHTYNALRITGDVAPIALLDDISDLYARGSQIWVGSRPSKRGGLVKALGLSIGSTSIHAFTASELVTPDEKVAKRQYHDRKDRRSKLQKVHGVTTARAVQRTTCYMALSRSW